MSGQDSQPANFIFPPMAGKGMPPDPNQLNAMMLGVGETRRHNGGFPIFFRKGYRAQNSSLAWSGNNIGKNMLLTSPMKYNIIVNTRRTAKDVRVPATRPLPSRAKAAGLPSGV